MTDELVQTKMQKMLLYAAHDLEFQSLTREEQAAIASKEAGAISL